MTTTTLDADRVTGVGDRVRRRSDGVLGTITSTLGSPSRLLRLGERTWAHQASVGWYLIVRWDDNSDGSNVRVVNIERVDEEPATAVAIEAETALGVIDRLLREEAVSRGWCSDFEAFVARVNREVGREVLGVRPVTYEGVITVRFNFESSRNGDARAAADVIRLAIEECVSAHPFEISNLTASTTATRA